MELHTVAKGGPFTASSVRSEQNGKILIVSKPLDGTAAFYITHDNPPPWHIKREE